MNLLNFHPIIGDGKLVVIEGFSDGTLTEYRSENLEKHPDGQRAQELSAKPQ